MRFNAEPETNYTSVAGGAGSDWRCDGDGEPHAFVVALHYCLAAAAAALTQLLANEQQ
jgi:hypothetical protein